MKKLVQDGLIGKPIHAEAGYFRTGDFGERGMPVDDPQAKPGPDLDWKAFLGDRPQREFSVDRFFRWRLFEDYAGGPVTDLYPHSVTQVLDILELGFPERVTGIGSVDRYEYELREVPDSFTLTAHFPEKVTVTVMGTQGNDHTAVTARGAGSRTPVIRGWDGTLTVDPDNRHINFTPVREKGAKKPQRIPIEGGESVIEHWRNLVECVQRNAPQELWSPMDLAFRTQTMLQMAMLADRGGRTMHFDAAKLEITA
jgi:predicted dehydrogenase